LSKKQRITQLNYAVVTSLENTDMQAKRRCQTGLERLHDFENP